jgi:hypothetical protein
VNSYRGDADSPRWAELRKEIELKKSALQVEGRSAESRAAEFDRLNYLLQYRMPTAAAAEKQDNVMPVMPMISVSALELEALALEIELELLNF